MPPIFEKFEIYYRRLLPLIEPLLPSGLRLTSAGIQFISTIIVAHMLGDSGAADFFFWSAILIAAAPMANFGTDQLVLRELPRQRDAASLSAYLRVTRVITVVLGFCLGLCFMAYATISDGWQNWHLLLPIASIAIATVILNGESLKGVSRPMQGVLYGHFLPTSVFCLCLLTFGWKLNDVGVLCLFIGSFVLGALSLRFAADQPVLSRSQIGIPDMALLRKVRTEGLSLFLSCLTTSLTFMLPIVALKAFTPDSEVSYVTTAFRLSVLTIVLSTAIHSVFAPKLSHAAESGDHKKLFQLYRTTACLALLALGAPMVFCIAFPEMVMGIFGDSFREGKEVLRMFFIVNLVSLLLGPVVMLSIMVGKSALLAKTGVVKLILAIGCSFLLVPKIGGIGVPITLGIAYITEELIALAIILKSCFGKEKKPPATT